MTTIVYRAGIMAADSRAYYGDKVPLGSKVKNAHLDDGTLIGVSSTKVGGNEAVIAWYREGHPRNADMPEHFTMLAVKPNGEAYVAVNEPMISGPLTADYFAAGSGDQYALGALHHGACAVDAVRAGCALDAWSAVPIYAAKHDGTTWKLNS